MAHKLIIYVVHNHPTEYSHLLSYYEFPRGELVTFTFHISNLGNEYFNGILKEVTAKFGSTPLGDISVINNSPLIKIPSLAPQEDRIIYNIPLMMSPEGQGWLYCMIEADDKKEIQYYRAINSPSMQQWHIGVMVVNKEQLRIIKLLENINNKIKY